MLSGEKNYHVLVLDRADAELECLGSLLSEYVHDATVLKDLQTRCELAEKALASGLCEEELFALIAPVVAKLTEVLDAVRKADSSICIPDFILDGDSPEENERQSNTVDLMYAGAPQLFGEFLLYPVKGLNMVCKIVLEKAADAATASNADTSLDTTALSK